MSAGSEKCGYRGGTISHYSPTRPPCVWRVFFMIDTTGSVRLDDSRWFTYHSNFLFTSFSFSLSIFLTLFLSALLHCFAIFTVLAIFPPPNALLLLSSSLLHYRFSQWRSSLNLIVYIILQVCFFLLFCSSSYFPPIILFFHIVLVHIVNIL